MLLDKLWDQYLSEYPDDNKSYIIQQYSESHRFYHTLEHVNHLLSLFTKYENFIEHKKSMLLAILFHDIIYDPKSNINEEQSWLVCNNRFNEPHLRDMILSTKNHKLDNKYVNLFLDFDLKILSSRTQEYMKYANNIRKEYSFVEEKLYVEKRSEILKNMLYSEIYKTDLFSKYENKARKNIKHELTKLKLDKI